MIQEIFITTPAKKILYGDITKYPHAPQYPTHIMESARLSQLKINDVILSILYTNWDGFTAAKYLLDLRKHIEAKVLALNERNVVENYFVLVELLQGIGIIHKSKAITLPTLISPENVYIDVVENVHAIVASDGSVIKNSLFGSVIVDKALETPIKMVVDTGRRYAVMLKTGHEIVSVDNNLTVSGICEQSEALFCMYHVSMVPTTMIKLERVDNRYTFHCGHSQKFKFLTFRIPLPRTTYATKLLYKKGAAEFNLSESYVEWKFNDTQFTEESISIEKSVLEETVDDRPVQIYFNIPGWAETGLRVISCTCPQKPTIKFWITHTTQDSCYEIYH